MPAVLVVSRDKKQMGKAVLSKDVFTIGRSRRCDLRLDDEAVSRVHAVISKRENVFEILDRGSRNGTQINEKNVAGATVVAEGDVISIGPFDMRFYESAADHASEEELASETVFVSDTKMGWGFKRKQGTDKKKKHEGSLVVKLTGIEGLIKGAVFHDWEKALTIGRDATCDVVIPDDSVSKLHARIFKEGEDYIIENHSQSNGTFVEGVRVDKHTLKNGETIRIGVSTFHYSEIDPVQRKKTLFRAGMAAAFVVLLVVVIKLLQPEDQSEKLVLAGTRYMKQASYKDAQDCFEKALVINALNQDAKKGLEAAKKQSEIADLLEKARQAAEHEQFDDAKDICYSILRLNPNHPDARNLEAIIQSVAEARMALEAKNWMDAMSLLKKALKTYPDSSVIKGLLAKAESEVEAQGNLGKAREFLRYRQFESAQTILQKIPKTSLYYAEARGVAESIVSAKTSEEALHAAQASYSGGDLKNALACVQRGLEASPENSELLGLKTAILAIQPLAEELARATDILSSDNATEMQRIRKTCAQIIKLEKDPRNAIYLQAAEVESQLASQLHALADQFIQDGNQKLRNGKTTEALRFFVQALEADPTNEQVKQQVADIREKTADICGKHFREGVVHEELGQTDLAIESYETVLKLAVPGDSYYEKAQEKLRRLKK